MSIPPATGASTVAVWRDAFQKQRWDGNALARPVRYGGAFGMYQRMKVIDEKEGTEMAFVRVSREVDDCENVRTPA